MKTNFSAVWPVNKQATLDHYRSQLARATRELESARQIEKLAVDEAHRQRKRADALARRVQVLARALGAV